MKFQSVFLLLAVTALIVLAFFFEIGCSASKTIAAASVSITSKSSDIRSEVIGAKHDLAACSQPIVVQNVTSHLNRIDQDAVDIDSHAAAISENVTQVQDVVPFWQHLLKLTLIAAILGGVAFLLWRLGLFVILENGFQAVATGVHGLIGKFLGA